MTGFAAVGVLEKASHPPSENGANRPTIPAQTGFWEAQRLVCGPGKQQEIAVRIFDDEIPGAPRLLFQFLLKGNSGGLKFKKQQLDLDRGSDGHRCRQQFLALAERRVDYCSLDTP